MNAGWMMPATRGFIPSMVHVERDFAAPPFAEQPSGICTESSLKRGRRRWHSALAKQGMGHVLMRCCGSIPPVPSSFPNVLHPLVDAWKIPLAGQTFRGPIHLNNCPCSLCPSSGHTHVYCAASRLSQKVSSQTCNGYLDRSGVRCGQDVIAINFIIEVLFWPIPHIGSP